MFIFACVLTFILSSVLIWLLYVLRITIVRLNQYRAARNVARSAYNRRKRLYYDKSLTKNEKYYELLSPLS
jgi:hypothetical protein